MPAKHAAAEKAARAFESHRHRYVPRNDPPPCGRIVDLAVHHEPRNRVAMLNNSHQELPVYCEKCNMAYFYFPGDPKCCEVCGEHLLLDVPDDVMVTKIRL